MMVPGFTGDELYDDYIFGIPSVGIPELYKLSKSVYEEDMDAFVHSVKVSTMVHGTWYLAYRGVRAWDAFRHASKNVRGLSFHTAMQQKGAATGMITKRVALATLPLAAAGLLIYGMFEYQDSGLRFMGLGGGM